MLNGLSFDICCTRTKRHNGSETEFSGVFVRNMMHLSPGHFVLLYVLDSHGRELEVPYNSACSEPVGELFSIRLGMNARKFSVQLTWRKGLPAAQIVLTKGGDAVHVPGVHLTVSPVLDNANRLEVVVRLRKDACRILVYSANAGPMTIPELYEHVLRSCQHTDAHHVVLGVQDLRGEGDMANLFEKLRDVFQQDKHFRAVEQLEGCSEKCDTFLPKGPKATGSVLLMSFVFNPHTAIQGLVDNHRTDLEDGDSEEDEDDEDTNDTAGMSVQTSMRVARLCARLKLSEGGSSPRMRSRGFSQCHTVTFGGQTCTKGLVSLSLRLKCNRFGRGYEERDVHFVTTHMEEGCVGKSPQHAAMIALFGEDQAMFHDGRKKEVLRWEHTIRQLSSGPWARSLHSEPSIYFGDFNCRIVDSISQHGFGFVSPLARRAERYIFHWLSCESDARVSGSIRDALQRLYGKLPCLLFVPKDRFQKSMQRLMPDASAEEHETYHQQLEVLIGKDSSPMSGKELLDKWLKPLGLDFDQFLHQLQDEYRQMCEEVRADTKDEHAGLMLHLDPELYWEESEFRVSDMANVAVHGSACVPFYRPDNGRIIREEQLSELYCREHADAPPIALRETLRRVGLPSLEGRITFAPTYKHHGCNGSAAYECHSGLGVPPRGGAWCASTDYVNGTALKENRCPSFSDRIFFNETADSILTQLVYAKVPMQVDHDHVYSLFVL